MRFSKPSKSITPTADILAQIERVTGTSVAAEDIVVFEAAVASTRPLNKMGSIFHEGRISEDTLRQMADALNSGQESVPLHTLHAQGYELPIGKVFQGEVIRGADGEAELRAMFYIPASETQMAEKINLGIIDEVSIGLVSKSMLCSKCGFDYFGPEATFEHLYSHTCENNHTVGVDGTHVKLSGLDKWMELSLVSRGAASKPKILGRTKQVMAKDTYDRIAASGRPPEAVVLFTASDDKKEEPMDPELKALLDAMGAQITDLAAKVDGMAPKEPTAEELAAAAEVDAQRTAELDALKTELETEKARTAELEAELAKKKETTLNASGIPVGGVAASAIEDANKVTVKPSLAAFKTPKR